MKHLLTLLFFTSTFISLQAQPGTLDKSFGQGGLNYNAGPPMFIQSSALQADNKLIAGGSDDAAAEVTFRLIRYNADGSLDKTFGNGGTAATAFKDYVRGYGWTSVQVQPDGMIVAAGYLLINDYHNYPPYTSDIVLARFNADGTPDASFGKEGVVITDFGEYETANAMALQKDGKILLTGIYSLRGEGNDTNVLTVRYNADGSLDESFGGKGYVVYLYPGTGADNAHAIALQDDGKIVIAGDGSAQHFCIVLRYMPDGELDNSFGTNGEVATLFGSNEAEEQTLNSVVIDKQQRIIVAGRSNEDLMTVARYNKDGSPDKSFAEDGMKIFSFSPNDYYDEARTVLLLKDDRILLAGDASGISPTTDLALACLQPDGSFDFSFGTNGKVTTDFGGDETCNDAMLQTDGKILLTGDYIQSSTGYSLIARYNGYDQGKQPLLVRIKRWLLHHGISWQAEQNKEVRYYAVQRSADGIVYKEIAKLSNKTQVNKYEDASVLAGSSYYRLAAIGWDGSRTYSNTILIDDNAQVKVFPNPVRDNLQLQGLQSGKTSVSIVDLQGNVRSSSVAAGSNYSFNISKLMPGNYLLKLQHNNVTTTLPFVKE